MDLIYKTLLTICLLACCVFNSSADYHCGDHLGASTEITCNITSQSTFQQTATIPNNQAIGSEIGSYTFGNHQATYNIYNGGGTTTATLWGMVSGQSIAGICPGADSTMYASGDGSCLIGIQYLDTYKDTVPQSYTPFKVHSESLGGGSGVSNKASNLRVRFIYLGDASKPANMPIPASVYLVDSENEQAGDVIVLGSNTKVIANMQTCAGSGTTITLDPAHPSGDIGSTFGSTKSATYSVQCPITTDSTYTLQTTFSGPTLSTYTGFGLSSGSATGVGFQLKVGGTAVKNGSIISNIKPDASGVASLDLEVSYLKIADTVTPGDMVSTLTLSYLYQ